MGVNPYTFLIPFFKMCPTVLVLC